MDSTLIVNLVITPDCQIIAYDNTNYENTEIFSDVREHTIVEYLKDKDELTISQRTHAILGLNDPLLRTSLPLLLPTDGIFLYHRLLVPNLEHFLSEGIYLVKGKYFAVDGEIYFSETNFTTFSKEKVVLIDDYSLLWKARGDFNQIFWFNCELFSSCKLNNCLIKLLSKELGDAAKGKCDLKCTKKDTQEQLEIDFLFETSFALKYLTEQGRYKDAQRLLDSITSCNNICSDIKSSNSNCNCGKNI